MSLLDPSLRILCSKLIPGPGPEPEPRWAGLPFRRSWKTTFCLLLDLLEVLAAAGSMVQVQFSALLAAVSASWGFVQDRTLLLLKRVLLQEAGDDWSLGGLKSRDPDPGLRVLARSVLAAVSGGWLQTVQVEPGGFFGGTRPVPADQDQKPWGVTLRAVGLVVLRSTELQTLDPAGESSRDLDLTPSFKGEELLPASPDWLFLSVLLRGGQCLPGLWTRPQVVGLPGTVQWVSEGPAPLLLDPCSV